MWRCERHSHRRQVHPKSSTRQNVGNLSWQSALEWQSSSEQIKQAATCCQQAMSAESRFYPGWCQAPVLSGGSLIQTRWPFTKVLKTCGKFSLLPSLNPRSSRLILASPAHFASLSNFGWEKSERNVAGKIQLGHLLISWECNRETGVGVVGDQADSNDRVQNWGGGKCYEWQGWWEGELLISSWSFSPVLLFRFSSFLMIQRTTKGVHKQSFLLDFFWFCPRDSVQMEISQF